ncbi:MAG TPA: galactose-1-phosphate uridylyltransferase [Trebonia sp.]|nr:galactose-1-phosphate uridylyltransferase [Trebonia sp.]
MSKRVSRLSDGRELIYYDDAGSTLPADRPADTRPLESRPPVPELRLDPLTGEWISIAAARQDRTFLPPAELDPLAPAAPGRPTEIPGDYDVAVFENRFPSFGPDLAGPDTPIPNIGLGRSRPGFGRCEVISFGPGSTGSLASLGAPRMRTVIEALADRTAALSALPGIEQVFPFENRGEAIGVTLHHPHGQVYGYPYVTPRTSALLRSIAAYGPGLMADILRHERTSPRLLLAGEHFTAFVPFAARWPVEFHLLPHRHVPDLAATTAAERDELAISYRRLLAAIDLLYDTPTPYIAAWHQAPVRHGRDAVRLMLQVTSPRRAEARLKFLAGSESAMGAFIGDIPPERAAARLREALAAVPADGTVSSP